MIRTLSARASQIPAQDGLPNWAAAAFPEGLLRQSDGVWAPLDFEFALAEQARANMAAASRGGGQPAMSLHFETLLGRALTAGGLSVPSEAVILDLRSGDGWRSVFPWLSLLPSARLIASDPAAVLLATLYGQAALRGDAERVLCLVSEADSQSVAPGSVDLVSGVACLHELDDPDLAIAAAARALRPGGHAVFLLPFDGYGLMRLAYEWIRADARCWPDAPLDPGLDAALSALVDDIAARTMPDRSSAGFADLQQKWLFSRESLEAAARLNGFSSVRFLSHHDHPTLYRDMALIQLRQITGRVRLALPAWALAILDRFDAALPPPVKRLLMLEGAMILTR